MATEASVPQMFPSNFPNTRMHLRPEPEDRWAAPGKVQEIRIRLVAGRTISVLLKVHPVKLGRGSIKTVETFDMDETEAVIRRNHPSLGTTHPPHLRHDLHSKGSLPLRARPRLYDRNANLHG